MSLPAVQKGPLELPIRADDGPGDGLAQIDARLTSLELGDACFDLARAIASSTAAAGTPLITIAKQRTRAIPRIVDSSLIRLGRLD